MNLLTLKLKEMKRVLLLFMIILTLSCSKENIGSSTEEQTYSLVYTTANLEQFVTVYAGSEITYTDSFEFIESEYDEVNNTITIETGFNPVRIESNFYIENGTSVDIILYNSEGVVIDERTITQVNYTYVYEF